MEESNFFFVGVLHKVINLFISLHDYGLIKL